jgi:hypothetical protein
MLLQDSLNLCIHFRGCFTRNADGGSRQVGTWAEITEFRKGR